ncbi:MAG: hypothetical protein EBT35_01635 [Alphaproteobacteria bacterium]|nr:hypothetical protein [Alphaproteobacteria bacterium]
MKLINCPACNHQISSEALTCPSCGHGINLLFYLQLSELFLCLFLDQIPKIPIKNVEKNFRIAKTIENYLSFISRQIIA